MYKNRNLIYVNGKPYREQDLQDMIDYYRENYKPDIQLPSNWNADVSGQVFKNYPFYPAISKSTYRPELYYEKNCHYNISFKEFLDYIIENDPNQYTVMILSKTKDLDIITEILHVKNNDDGIYVYTDYYITEDGVDIQISNNLTTQDTLKEIIRIFNTNTKDQEIWYDFYTVGGVYSSRKRCVEYNKNYAKDMIIRYVKQFLNKVPTIVDKNTFIKYYSYYLYVLFVVLIGTNDNTNQATIDYIETYIELLNDGIPDDINEMNELLEDYIIKDVISINNKTHKIILNLTA